MKECDLPGCVALALDEEAYCTPHRDPRNRLATCLKTTCDDCEGRGVQWLGSGDEMPCARCHGSGKVPSSHSGIDESGRALTSERQRRLV